MRSAPPDLFRIMAAEFVGTFLLVFFGLGAVHAAVLLDSLVGLWQIGVVWGIAIMLAVYTVGGISGAHINPAITLALATWNQMPRARVLPYLAAQLAGAFAAAAALFTLFGSYLAAKESAKGVVRGEPGSVITALCYGEYYPNMGGLAAGVDPFRTDQLVAMQAKITEPVAFFAELLGTLILGFVVAGLTDERNRMHPRVLAPPFIGLTVTALICVLAPLTQACFNPARDFGPRLFAYLAGWGEVAIPGPNGRGIVTVYIVAPIVGAIVGMGLYRWLFLSHSQEATATGDLAS